MSEIGRPWQFHRPPEGAGFQRDAFGAWYVQELLALHHSTRGLCLTNKYNLGYQQGLEKALALLHPQDCSAGGALFTPTEMGYEPTWETLPTEYLMDLKHAWRAASREVFGIHAPGEVTWEKFIAALEARMREDADDRAVRAAANREYQHAVALGEVKYP